MSRLLRISCVGLTLLLASNAIAKSPFSLVQFKRSKAVAQSSQLLTDDNGPWMIFVGSFAGPGAEEEARQLVQTLRNDFRMSAYLHKKRYDFSDSVEGKGFDMYGHRKRMRYASDASFDEVAVLIGDFATVDDPKLQKTLSTVKYASRDKLNLKGKQAPTTRRFAELREFHKKFIRGKENQQKGPMSKAFVTRNPLIPREAFAPKGLDPGLIELNKRVKYSLLKNPGKYTVRIASFRGQVIIDQQKIHEIETNKRAMDGRIQSVGDKSEHLAKILRKEGVEAYVYHDFHESIVTVGSFAEIGKELPNGAIDLFPAVAQIMESYGPSKKKFSKGGVALAGIQPRKKGPYMLDVAPQPVLVPRKSIATDYLSRN